MDSGMPLPQAACTPAKSAGSPGDRDVMGPYGWVWMIVWIVVLIVMVWLIVRGPAERTAAEDAMAILRARFARGEISQDEFERARSALLVDQAQTRGETPR